MLCYLKKPLKIRLFGKHQAKLCCIIVLYLSDSIIKIPSVCCHVLINIRLSEVTSTLNCLSHS